MKKPTIYEIAFLLLVLTFCYSLNFTITQIVLSKIPTNADNKELRALMLQQLNGVGSIIYTILGYKLRDLIEKKNENK